MIGYSKKQGSRLTLKYQGSLKLVILSMCNQHNTYSVARLPYCSQIEYSRFPFVEFSWRDPLDDLLLHSADNLTKCNQNGS
jgi:hypothetical protein